ncbi:MAG: hypothetical protein ACTSWG_10380 [Candidatus Helarchaeota archaeon]
MKAGTLKFKENWKIETVDKKTGKILDSEEICNTIVNNGLERMAKLLVNVSSTHFNALAIGTDDTAVTNSDTALGTEIGRSSGATLSYEADYKAKFQYTFSFGSAYSIVEAGIFDSETVSGSTMLARTTFSAKSVSASVDLIVTAIITVARV